MERQWWPEMPLILGRSGTQYVAMVKAELRKPDRTVGVNYCIFSNISSGTA